MRLIQIMLLISFLLATVTKAKSCGTSSRTSKVHLIATTQGTKDANSDDKPKLCLEFVDEGWTCKTVPITEVNSNCWSEEHICVGDTLEQIDTDELNCLNLCKKNDKCNCVSWIKTESHEAKCALRTGTDTHRVPFAPFKSMTMKKYNSCTGNKKNQSKWWTMKGFGSEKVCDLKKIKLQAGGDDPWKIKNLMVLIENEANGVYVALNKQNMWKNNELVGFKELEYDVDSGYGRSFPHNEDVEATDIIILAETDVQDGSGSMLPPYIELREGTGTYKARLHKYKDAPDDPDQEIKSAYGVGKWGAYCTCPSGKQYIVGIIGDKYNDCSSSSSSSSESEDCEPDYASWACVGGKVGRLHSKKWGHWSQKKVICHTGPQQEQTYTDYWIINQHDLTEESDKWSNMVVNEIDSISLKADRTIDWRVSKIAVIINTCKGYYIPVLTYNQKSFMMDKNNKEQKLEIRDAWNLGGDLFLGAEPPNLKKGGYWKYVTSIDPLGDYALTESLSFEVENERSTDETKMISYEKAYEFGGDYSFCSGAEVGLVVGATATFESCYGINFSMSRSETVEKAWTESVSTTVTRGEEYTHSQRFACASATNTKLDDMEDAYKGQARCFLYRWYTFITNPETGQTATMATYEFDVIEKAGHVPRCHPSECIESEDCQECDSTNPIPKTSLELRYDDPYYSGKPICSHNFNQAAATGFCKRLGYDNGKYERTKKAYTYDDYKEEENQDENKKTKYIDAVYIGYCVNEDDFPSKCDKSQKSNYDCSVGQPVGLKITCTKEESGTCMDGSGGRDEGIKYVGCYKKTRTDSKFVKLDKSFYDCSQLNVGYSNFGMTNFRKYKGAKAECIISMKYPSQSSRVKDSECGKHKLGTSGRVAIYQMIKNYSDPCLVNNGGCDNNAFCKDEKKNTVVECKCKPGYSGNGKNCEKNYSDPCFVNNGGCDKNAFCEDENEDEVSECKCKPGYSGNGKNCINNCQDEHTNCPFWATHGECSNSPTYMHAYCKKSCGLLCKDICEDEHTKCPFWATHGECSNSPTYMHAYCKKSCKKCGQAAGDDVEDELAEDFEGGFDPDNHPPPVAAPAIRLPATPEFESGLSAWEEMESMYEKEIADSTVCPTANGRCGPKFNNAYCSNRREQTWDVYCNEANGWCGVTSAHKNAQKSTRFDGSEYEKCLKNISENAPSWEQDPDWLTVVDVDGSTNTKVGQSSSLCSGGVLCAKGMFDGVDDTRWHCNKAGPCSFELDLGEERILHSVYANSIENRMGVLTFETKLEESDQYQAYETLTSGVEYSGNSLQVLFQSIRSARYVKVTVDTTPNAGDIWPAIGELKLKFEICPKGYKAIPENLDGSGKVWAQPHPDSSRSMEDCATICYNRNGCTGFEYAEGPSEHGACGTYTGGDSNIKQNENRLNSGSNWRSCMKETSSLEKHEHIQYVEDELAENYEGSSNYFYHLLAVAVICMVAFGIGSFVGNHYSNKHYYKPLIDGKKGSIELQ